MPLTGTISGTTAPVRVRLKNRRPDIVRLEGGDDQVVISSGGTPNTWTRTITGLTLGTLQVDVDVAEPKEGGGTPPELIAADFQRVLTRVAAELNAATDALPFVNERGRRRLLFRADMLNLLRKTQTDLRAALPYPELTAFHDAVAELVRQAELEIDAAVVRRGPRAIAGFIALVQTGSGGTAVQAGPAKKVLRYIASIFSNAGKTSPLGTICVLTTPMAGATVVLHPASDPSEPQEIRSASPMTLYLGRYAYLVTKDPYPRSSGFVDFLVNPQRVIECPVRRTTRDSQACRLLSRAVEPCR